MRITITPGALWLPAAASAVHRAFWARRPGQRGWFLIMPCAAWLLVWYAVGLYLAVKACVWLCVVELLVIAQVLWLPFTIRITRVQNCTPDQPADPDQEA